MGKKSRSTVSTKRRSRTSQLGLGEKVILERILGLTSQNDASLTCCPCGTGCVAYSAGCVIIIFNPKKNRQEFLFNVSRKTITALAFSQDGKYLVSGECGHNPAVRVWDVKERTEICSFNGHKFGITCVAFIPVTGYIVSVGEQHDMVINVWDWKSGSGRISSGKIATMVTDIAFSEDGNTFVTVGNRSVKFWYFTGKSKTRQTLPLHGRNSILGEQKHHLFCSVTFGCDSNSNRVYAITKSGLLCEFNEERMLDKWVELRTRQAYCISASEDHLFVGCADGVMRIFSASTLHFVTTFPKPHHLRIDVAAGTSKDQIFSPKENASYPDAVATVVDKLNRKLTCIYSDHSLYVWDIHDVHKIGKQWSFLYHSSCIWGIDMYPELNEGDKATLPRNTFSTCSSDNTVRVWNIDPAMDTNIFNKNIHCPELLKILYSEDSAQDENGNEGKEGVRSLCFSPDGQMLASGDRSGNIRVYDLLNSNMNELHKIEAHDAEVLCLEFSEPDTGHKLLASASRDRFIHIFDMNKNCSLLQTLDDHSSSITSVKFAQSNGRFQMMSCSADKALLFRVATWNPDLQFSLLHHVGSKTTLYDMAVDVSKKYVATACQDRNLRIHNIGSGKLKQTYKGSQSDDGTLIKVTLDPSGIYAATSCSDKTLAIYDFYSGVCVATMLGHSELVTGLKFTNDCRQLISVSGDGCIFVWKLPFDMINNMKDRINERAQRLEVVAQINQTRRMTFVVPNDAASIHPDSDPSIDQQDLPPEEIKGPPDYRFSITGLPLWAQRRVAGEDVPASDESTKPVQPRGKWARSMAADGFLMMANETAIPIKPTDQDKRRYSFETEAMDEMDEDEDEFFVPAEQMFGGTESPPLSPMGKVRSTRGSDAMTLSRESSVVDSIDGDDEEDEAGLEEERAGQGEGDIMGAESKEEEDDDVQEVIIYPEEDGSFTECLDFQVTESTLSVEEHEKKKHKRANSRELLLSKETEGTTETQEGLDSPELSDDDDDVTPDVTPNVTPLSSPMRQKATDPSTPEEDDEIFLQTNFSFQEKERFDQCLEQLASQDQGQRSVLDRRMSITGRFIQRSRTDSVGKLESDRLLEQLLKKRQEDTRKAVQEMRKRLETSSITSIREVKTPPPTPNEEDKTLPQLPGTNLPNQSTEEVQTSQSETEDNANRTTGPPIGAISDNEADSGRTNNSGIITGSSKTETVLSEGDRVRKSERSSIDRPKDLKLPHVIDRTDAKTSNRLDSESSSNDQVNRIPPFQGDTRKSSNNPVQRAPGPLTKGDLPGRSKVPVYQAAASRGDVRGKPGAPPVVLPSEGDAGGKTKEELPQTAIEMLSAKAKVAGEAPSQNVSKTTTKEDGSVKDGNPLRGRSILSPMKRSSSLSRIAQQDNNTSGEGSKTRLRRSLSTDRPASKNELPNTSARQKHRAKNERTSSPLLRSYETGTESTLAKIKRKVGSGARRARKSLPPSGPLKATVNVVKPPESARRASVDERTKVSSVEMGTRLTDDGGKLMSNNESKPLSDEKGKPSSGEKGKPLIDERVKPFSDEQDKPSPEDRSKLLSDEKDKPLSDDRGKPLSAEKDKPLSDDRGKPLSDERDEPSIVKGGKLAPEESTKSPTEPAVPGVEEISIGNTRHSIGSTDLRNDTDKSIEEMDRTSSPEPQAGDDIVTLSSEGLDTSDGSGSLEEDHSLEEAAGTGESCGGQDPPAVKINGGVVQSSEQTGATGDEIDSTRQLGATPSENGAGNLVSVLEDSIKQVNDNFSQCLSTLTELQESGNATEFNRGLQSLTSTYATMGTSLDHLKKSQREAVHEQNAGSVDLSEMQSCLSQLLHPAGANGTRQGGDLAAQAAMNLLDKYSMMLVTMVTNKLNGADHPQENNESEEDDRDVIDC